MDFNASKTIAFNFDELDSDGKLIEKGFAYAPVDLIQYKTEEPYQITSIYNSTMFVGIVFCKQPIDVNLVNTQLLVIIAVSAVSIIITAIFMFACVNETSRA